MSSEVLSLDNDSPVDKLNMVLRRFENLTSEMSDVQKEIKQFAAQVSKKGGQVSSQSPRVTASILKKTNTDLGSRVNSSSSLSGSNVPTTEKLRKKRVSLADFSKETTPWQRDDSVLDLDTPDGSFLSVVKKTDSPNMSFLSSLEAAAMGVSQASDDNISSPRETEEEHQKKKRDRMIKNHRQGRQSKLWAEVQSKSRKSMMQFIDEDEASAMLSIEEDKNGIQLRRTWNNNDKYLILKRKMRSSARKLQKWFMPNRKSTVLPEGTLEEKSMTPPHTPRGGSNTTQSDDDKKPTMSMFWLRPFVINPSNPKRRMWDMLMFIVIAFLAVDTPYRLSFETKNSLREKFMDWLVFSIFCIDIVLNFMTSYIREHKLVINRSKIAYHYLRTWFFLDFLATFPFEVLFQFDNSSINSSNTSNTVDTLKLGKLLRLAQLGRLVRLLRLLRMMSYFQELERYSRMNPALVRIFKQVFFIFISLHWTSS